MAPAMDVDRSSLCNCVVNFLLEEKYLLSAFELLHELLEDGRHDQAIRLRDFFADPALFPPDQIARFNSLRVADPQTLLEEKMTIEEKLSITEYELRLAQEDLSRIKLELQKTNADIPVQLNGPSLDVSTADGPKSQQNRRDGSFSSLGPLKDAERKDLNCAVKEYLLVAGYRLAAMTFIEEVPDQNLDVWPNSSACVPDALRRYYYQYLSSTSEAAEEKLSILRHSESLEKENERLNNEKDLLLKNRELTDSQIVVLKRSLEATQKDLKDREILVQGLKQSLDLQRKELNECRAEITSLKMHIEGAQASRGWAGGESGQTQALDSDNNKEEVKPLHPENDSLKQTNSTIGDSESISCSNEDAPKEKLVETNEVGLTSHSAETAVNSYVENAAQQSFEGSIPKPINPSSDLTSSSGNANGNTDISEDSRKESFGFSSVDGGVISKSDTPRRETSSDRTAFESIQILSDALPRIVPYVLINHREELLPLIMCAIERHPDSNVRDSLTHTLFNLIKRPDEQQRRIIMDACVSLAKNVGEMRTETELLPQCWEQINHTYEERRLLVAQSCGELAEFVRPEIRDSLILSIVQQLVEDSATVVREAAAHNLALLLPFFPNMDKYYKVEELMFHLACDPSRAVVETTLKELVQAVVQWGGKLDHVLRVLLPQMLGFAQRCPPLSGVEGSIDSHLRVLGERERWNIEIFLQMLMELLPFIREKAIESCPFTSSETLKSSEEVNCFFSISLLQLYASHLVQWPAFDWMHTDCFPVLIQLTCLLPHKEDKLRNRMTKFLLDVFARFGDQYLVHIMLPVFLVAVGDGDSADLTYFPSSMHSRIKGLRPKTAVAERLAITCVLPLLLSGILGAPTQKERLLEYLRKILVQNSSESSWSMYRTSELIDAVRFLCTFEEHHGIIFNILWEMVVSSNADLKINAANLLKVLVPYIDAKVASTHVLPALVTLGSDQYLNVKYASIDAFGAVAQHFKNDMIVDKIRIQMDAFLEDGSHEATISVVHALVVAVPHTTDRLREYLLSKIFHLTAMPSHGNDILRRRERANTFCEAIRALDATEIPPTSIREFLLPAIQNLLKDPDALDPAHKEALEVIMKERSGGTLESIGKAMGAHLGIASSMSSFFGESASRGKKESGGEASEHVASPQPSPVAQQDETAFRRIKWGGLGDMLRSRTAKGGAEDASPRHSS